MKKLFAVFVIISLSGCATTFLKKDPMVQVVNALTDVLKAQKPLPAPPPAATPKVCFDPTNAAVAVPCPTPEVK